MLKPVYTFILLFIFGFAFLGQDWWFISDWDDIFYKFVVEDSHQGTVWQLMSGKHHYVNSFSDIIHSQCNHYIGTNGRFIVHCIVQAFTSFMTPHQFAIINSLVFTILLWGMTLLSDKKMALRNAFFVSISLAVLSPLTMADFWGNISWSINYLWSATATVWWLVYYESVNVNESEKTIPHLLLAFLLSVLVGSLQEGFCVGICASLGIYHLLRIKDLTLPKIVVVGGYILGSCICVFAPANWRKVDSEAKGVSIDAMLDLLMTYSILLFCILLVLCYILSKNKCRKYLRDNAVLFTSFIFTLCFCLFFVYHGSRQYTLSTLLSIVLTIRLIKEMDNKVIKVLQGTIIVIGLILCIIFYPRMYKMRMNIGKAYYEIVKQEMETKDRVVYNAPYEIARFEIEESGLNQYFHINFFNGNPESRYLSIHVSEGTDFQYIEAVLPVSIYEMENKCKETEVACLYNDIYACALNEKNTCNNVVLMYQTTFRNPNKWHESSSTAQYMVCHNGKYYYLFHAAKNKIRGEHIVIKENG